MSLKNPGLIVKKSFFSVLFLFVFIGPLKFPSSSSPDSLSNILQLKDKISREKGLVSYIMNYFIDVPVNRLSAKKTKLINLLNKYNVDNTEALDCLIESAYQDALSHAENSKEAMIKAIQIAHKEQDDYLSYVFLSFWAYKQTEEGNITGAVASYREANKEAIKLNDANLQLKIDINISDVFYKSNFYNQSLFYLNQAQGICNTYWPDDQRIKNVLYYNKSENFFRMGKADSLKVYNEKLKTTKANTYKLYTYKNRTDYYLYLLNHQYKKAISLIHAMRNDGGYIFENEDLQNLADAYYKNGQPDSAKFVINRLLSSPVEANHPEIKYHLYEVLGKIAERRANYKSATGYFKQALQQSVKITTRLTQVDNISSLIKADEMEGYYTQKNETYKRERIWLIIAVVFAILIILVIALLYRTIKQKRHYEKLLFTAKKEELAFINSHDVRKHLTNILGLIEVIRHSDNRGKEYLQAEHHLFDAAKNLDKSIRNISEKLSE
jgi:hypothetical protein